MIRIISGLYKGKKLKRVRSPLVRPLPGKVKETLFNIIQEKVKGSHFLDGFAGTGSVGIEALSRLAEFVVFIEEYYPAVKVIKSNLQKCNPENNFLIIHKEFNRAVIKLSKENKTFDIIFLDPPYRLLDKRNPLKVIKKRHILKTNGLIILRHHFKTQFDAKYFRLLRKTRCGDDTLAFYKQEPAQSQEKVGKHEN